MKNLYQLLTKDKETGCLFSEGNYKTLEMAKSNVTSEHTKFVQETTYEAETNKVDIKIVHTF